MNPFYRQELVHLQDLTSATTKGGTGRNLYQGNVEQLRLQTGFPGSFTNVPFEAVGKFTTSDTIIQSLWENMEKFEIQFEDPFTDFQPA